MEKEQRPHILVIPEYDECNNLSKNGTLSYIETILPYFAKNQTSMHYIETPEKLSDFGQNKCQEHLRNKINWCKKNKTLYDTDPLIIYGSSQGSATAINYTAKNPKNIKALILENIMFTGNSAIENTFVGDTSPSLSDDPIAHTIGGCCRFTNAGYYLLPQLVRTHFWHYSPTGEQPIDNINDLPDDLPIIILHNTKLSCKNAQALYAFLTITKQNPNVYLANQKNIIDTTAINTILKLHNLLPVNYLEKGLTLDELKEYQPAVQQEWFDHLNGILKKEKNMPYVIPSIIGTCAGLYMLGAYLGII
jgi:hypothetical protein